MIIGFDTLLPGSLIRHSNHRDDVNYIADLIRPEATQMKMEKNQMLLTLEYFDSLSSRAKKFLNYKLDERKKKVADRFPH